MKAEFKSIAEMLKFLSDKGGTRQTALITPPPTLPPGAAYLCFSLVSSGMGINGLYQGAAPSPDNARSRNATARAGPRDASAVLRNKGFACICAHINMQALKSLKKQLSAQLGWGG